jgi:hypothetical protein
VANKATSSIDANTTSDINDTNPTSQPNDPLLHYLWYFLKVLLIFQTLRDILHLTLYRWTYILSLENWLEMLLIIAIFLSYSGVVESAQVKCHLSAVALLLGWVELLLLTGRLPQLSLKLEMLKTVSLTFLSFMSGYVLLLIAFALSFYILFKASVEGEGTETFAHPLLSLKKTILMFAGEYETSSLSFETLPYTSHVIFLLFVFLVAIILLNLLNGLAVNDTEQITKVAESLSLKSRVTLLSRIEGLVNALPKCIRPDIELKEEMFVIHPNQHNKIGSAAVQSLLSIISEKTQPEEKEKSTAFQKEWRMFTQKLSELQILHEKLQKKFESMFDE